MSDTATSRKYAWGLQTAFGTPKPLAAGALRKMLLTDKNFIDYEAKTANDAEWSHGYNSETDEWIEGHDAKVAHTMPAFAQELGRIFILNMEAAITTPSGGVTAKTHTFKPTDPNTTRQDKSVTYVEKIGAGWHKLMEDAVADGFTLKGSELGVLMCDFNLMGNGRVVNNPAVTYPPTATPTVVNPVGLTKFFNTGVSITPNDNKGGGYNAPYGCRYRSFEIAFKKTMLSDAGYQPGCARYLVPGNPDSGVIRSAHEFDRQTLDFNFEVDMAAGTPEFEAVQDQRPINLGITATAGIIEAAIPHSMVVQMNVAKYKTTKPVEAQGMMRFGISGKAYIDVAGSQNLFTIALTTNVANFATGW